MALNALAQLYTAMKEYDKGFEALEEAFPVAAKTNSPGRMATLKDTEYGLAIETNQPKRALKALLAGLALERQIGADKMVATSLVNLSDSYLKEHDYRNTLSYANQAIEAARPLHADQHRSDGARQHRPGLSRHGPPGRRQAQLRSGAGGVRENRATSRNCRRS